MCSGRIETPLVRHSEAPRFHQRREESREHDQMLHARSFAPPGRFFDKAGLRSG
jgi:hypothetical protein